MQAPLVRYIVLSSDCSCEKHILSVSSRCSSLAGWILRTFTYRDKITMLTLFKSLVLSRLDYGVYGVPSYGVRITYKVKDISLLESVQRALTKHIKGMHTYFYLFFIFLNNSLFKNKYVQ